MSARRRSYSCPRHPPSSVSSPSPTMSLILSMRQLGWEAAALGLVNLASEVDVAVCRLHYYLQRVHGLKTQLESLWRPTPLRMSSLEAMFHADVESYLVGVRQDAARLEAAQFALRRLLATDSSSPGSGPGSGSASGYGSSAGESPRKSPSYLRRASISPRQPALATLKEESSRSDSDKASKGDVRDERKHKNSGDRSGSDPALLAAELEKLLEGKSEQSEALDASTTGGGASDWTQESYTGGLLAAGGGSLASSSSGGGGAAAAGDATPASDLSGSGERAEATGSSQDLSMRVQWVSPRSALEEIGEQQASLYDHLQVHSQRLLLVASTRRRFGRRRRQPATEDPRALQLAAEAAVRELLSARQPLLRGAEALRSLAAAIDEARPLPPPPAEPQPPPAEPQPQLQHLPSLRPQPLPQLRGARRPGRCPPPGACCAFLRRVLRSWDCLDACARVWDFLRSCFCCCCAYRPSFPVQHQPVYESTWLVRSPPRGYSTSPL